MTVIVLPEKWASFSVSRSKTPQKKGIRVC